MSKHTPGPWEIRMGGFSDSDEGFSIASRFDPSFGIVAECWPCTTSTGTRKAIRANARLIAAAPELLDLAYLMLSMLALMRAGEPITPSTVSYMTAKIEAEIAKATGA